MKKDSKLAAFFGINKYERAGAIATLSILIALVLALLLNALIGFLPYSLVKPTITGQDTFDLSGTTVDWLKGLKDDVTIHMICTGGKSSADSDIYGFLMRYEEESKHVNVNVVNPSDNPDFILKYGGEWPEDMSVIVESRLRYKLIPATSMFYYYNSNLNMKMTPEEYQYAMDQFSQEAYVAYLPDFVATTTAHFDGESRVTNALNYVTRQDLPIVYALTGAGATDPEAALKSFLSDTCYDMRTTSTLAELPEDCDLLMINAPTADLSEAEATALGEYLAADGKLLLTTYYLNTQELPVLASVLAEYGLGFAQGTHVVIEGHTNYAISSSKPYFFKAHVRSEHASMQDFNGTVLCYYAHAITMTETQDVSHASLLYTSAAGYLTTYDEENKKWVNAEEKEALTVGALAQKGNTKILWVASPDALTANVNSYSADNGNFNFVLQAMNYMTGVGTDSIAIESALLDSSFLGVTSMQFLIFGILFVIVIPVAVLTVGIVVWYVRKKK